MRNRFDRARISMIMVFALALAGCTSTSVGDDPTASSSTAFTVAPEDSPPDTSPRSPEPTVEPSESTTPPTKPTTPPTKSTAPPTISTASPTDDEQAERLGCHEYCQNAGPTGNGGEGTALMVEVSADDPVIAFDDGTIPVRVTCLVEQECIGASLTYQPGIDEYGRSDLQVAAGRSRLLAVPLPAPAIEMIDSGENVEIMVIADTGLTWQRMSTPDQNTYTALTLIMVVVVGS